MILIPNVCVYVCVNVCEREREGAADVGERSKKGTFAWVDTSLAHSPVVFELIRRAVWKINIYISKYQPLI